MKKWIVLCLFLPFLTACLPEKAITFPVSFPNGASDVERISFKERGGVGEQIGFNINRRYPDTGTMAFYENFFEKEGWTALCQNEPEWRDVIKARSPESGLKDQDVKQLAQIMTLKEKEQTVFIIVFYNGPDPQVKDSTWDYETQEVVLSFASYKGTGLDFNEVLAQYKNHCAP